MGTFAIHARNLTRRYRDAVAPALHEISLEIPMGACVFLTGPSGSGKSTLLNLFACLDAPDGGELEVLGEPVHSLGESALRRLRSTRIGMVFQHHLLPPGLSSRESVAAAMLWSKRATPVAALKRADELLHELGLTDEELTRPVQNLSGGQRQRVAFARAVAPGPELLLADEPTAQLDDATAASLSQSLARWKSAAPGRTLIVSTHEHQPTVFGDIEAITIRLKAGRLDP